MVSIKAITPKNQYVHNNQCGHSIMAITVIWSDQYIMTGLEVIRYNTAARPTREIEALTTFEAIQTFLCILANVSIKAVMEIDAIMTYP